MKTSKLSLNETAQMLGVSKATLRNWDKSGKLKSCRNPMNNYRYYPLDAVLRLKGEIVAETPLVEFDSSKGSIVKESPAAEFPAPATTGEMSEDTFKRHLARLQRCLRDAHGDSSLVSRFDELSKLLFAKVLSENKRGQEELFTQLLERDDAYARRIRAFYEEACAQHASFIPERFRKLNLPDAAIVAAGQILAALRLSGASADIKGIAYEEMIRNTFDKGDNQQFFTPREITSFLVAMLATDTDGASVCDPASGTGGFLVEALRQKTGARKFTAFEIDERLAWVSSINLFLGGAKDFRSTRLDNGGSLGPEGEKFAGAFDVIITNPPFGSDFSDTPELQKYTLGRGCSSRRRGILFIERCLRMLNNGGILGMVIDEGVLSLASAQDVREFIRDNADLLAVVSLPETAFMPYASVNTSIIVLRKMKKPSRRRTFFAKAENIGRKPNGEPDIAYDDAGNAAPNSDLGGILGAWREFYLHGKTPADQEHIFLAEPFAEPQQNPELRLDFRFHHPARLLAAAAIRESKHPVVSLGEICIERNESCVPSVDFPDQFIYYTGLAQMEAGTGAASQVYVPAQSLKSAVKKFYRNDILFARMRPNLRKCHFAEFAHDGYTSSECLVLTVRRNADGSPMFDPFLLSVLLRSDFVYGQIMHQVAGIGRPRLASKDFKHILVPVPPRTVQSVLKDTFLKAVTLSKNLELEASRLIQQAVAMRDQSVENIARNLCGAPHTLLPA